MLVEMVLTIGIAPFNVKKENLPILFGTPESLNVPYSEYVIARCSERTTIYIQLNFK
jgi:hypothetical protein